MNNYLSLSPSQFETLAADVLSAIHEVYFQRFPEGPDGGIDCKYVGDDGSIWIGQAKRSQSTATLIRKLQKEQVKMSKLDSSPNRYFLVAACGLTDKNKERIKEIMHPFVLSTADIYGKDDLDALLQEHTNVYRKNYPLWLNSVEQLNAYLQHANTNRIQAEYEQLFNEKNSYVNPIAENQIHKCLDLYHTCLIVGEPGAGKSTTAGQVALQLKCLNSLAELIWINDRNFESALQLIRKGSEQILVLDDFLGATFLDTDGMLSFSKDWQAILSHAQESQGKLKVIFTTRGYILKQALDVLGDVQPRIKRQCSNLVYMEHNSAKFRVDLLYSLISSANLHKDQLSALIRNDLYWHMLIAEYFSPRLYAQIIDGLIDLEPKYFESHIKLGVTGQFNIWQNVFKLLSPEAQALLYLISITGKHVPDNLLNKPFSVLYQKLYGRIAPLNSFSKALTELEPTFIKTEVHLDKIWINPKNASVIDFLHKYINENHPLVDALIDSLECLSWGLQHFAIKDD